MPIIYHTMYSSYTIPYTHHKPYHIRFINHTIYPSYTVPYNHHKPYHMPIIYRTMCLSYTIPYTHHKPYYLHFINHTIYSSYVLSTKHTNNHNTYNMVYTPIIKYSHNNSPKHTKHINTRARSVLVLSRDFPR